ncbi:MAG: DUF4421 family protein [Cytophagales bacterium]|nr:DUF4421 family protein [Cytophaga sp.]
MKFYKCAHNFHSMRISFYILILSHIAFLLHSDIALSQDTIKKKTPLRPDSNFIVSYPQDITLGIYTASPLMQVVITPVSSELDKYRSDFRGNFSDQLGFLFSYRGISISAGFKTPFGKKSEPEKGRTVSTGITLKVKKPNYLITAEYRRYSGYYDNNAPNYTALPDGSYYVRSDVQYKNIGVNGVYNFSWKKYSYNAPLTFNDRQLKSRIGFITKAGINYLTINSSDSTLLTETQTSQFTSFNSITSIHALLLKAGPGVGLNIVVFKRFYFAFNYFLMGNFIQYNYSTETAGTSVWYTNANIYTETALGFGYNSRRLFAGFSANGDINVMRIQGANVRTNFASVVMTLGYRFNSPAFFTKGWDKTVGRLKKS